jgi:hypothetical protein
MPELAALEGAVGLASSIISFISFSIEFSKLVREVAKTQGELPKELDDCREYIEIVASWLDDINQGLAVNSSATEEDKHLEEAIRRCAQTSSGLTLLLRTLSSNAVRDSPATLGQKTRASFSTLKRAGKIMWKRDEIAAFRNKLRENRDDVHAHLATRISRQVKRILSVEIIHL